MSRIQDCAPDPRSHIKTLMKIGYTMQSAVADIIDNSITAKSKNIEIYSPPGTVEPFISILDDGYGMDPDELINNMRIGSKDPSLERRDGDLGRFGSGMKTASFSQARRLTVISKKMNREATAAIWDIDLIQAKNNWCLEVLDESEIASIPNVKINEETVQGTQIIWEKLSCFPTGNHSYDHDTELATHLTLLRNHLALHFHRFLSGKNKCAITINNQKINPIDPFMTTSEGYQEGRSEKLRCKGGYIYIQTHVLPHFNRMNHIDLELLGGAEGIAQNQGVYIYRANRLINAGGWLGLEKNSQLGALARVQVDVPTSLDEEWSIDVKKSSLELPQRVKRELRKFLSDPIKRSKKVYSYRGAVDVVNEFWKITENENDGRITYQANPTNNKLIRLLSSCDHNLRSGFITYLKDLSANIPINHIYQKMSESPKNIDQNSIDSDSLDCIIDEALKDFFKNN